MIVVKVELWSAVTGEVTLLGHTIITNDGTRTENFGNYNVVVARKGVHDLPYPLAPNGPKPARTGRVENYPRKSYSIWRLVSRALRSAFPEER